MTQAQRIEALEKNLDEALKRIDVLEAKAGIRKKGKKDVPKTPEDSFEVDWNGKRQTYKFSSPKFILPKKSEVGGQYLAADVLKLKDGDALEKQKFATIIKALLTLKASVLEFVSEKDIPKKATEPVEPTESAGK